MNLHKNPGELYDTLLVVGDRLNTSPAIIEKDYYVTMFLEALAKRVPNLLFKGGTSLSKCHKIINRFSEDIDLTLDADNQTQGNKRNLKYEIIEVCNDIERQAFAECESLTDVYYKGSQEEWWEISIGIENSPLINATIHYNYTGE